MDDLNINRSLANRSIQSAASGMNANPFLSESSFSSPLFTCGYTSLSGSFNNFRSFDSNLYFNTFGSAMPMLSNAILTPFVMPSFAMPVFTMPTFSFSTFRLPKLSLKRTTPSGSYKKDNSVMYQSLIDAGYNKKLAKKLAKDASRHAESKSIGYCSLYVSNALERLGIVGKRGHAYELRDSLRNNPHFREIDVSTVDVTKLPAGCILVYQRGDAGYSREFGHVEITLGNGCAASDFINKKIKKSSKMSVFVPVSA